MGITELTPFLPTNFAMAAKVGPLEWNGTSESQGKNKKAVKPITKGRLQQALNVKLNQMIFNLRRPLYQKGKKCYISEKLLKLLLHSMLTYNLNFADMLLKRI